MTHNPNVYGYVNGKPVFSRDEFIFEHRKRGPIEDDAELIAFAEKATSGWHNAGWSHTPPRATTASASGSVWRPPRDPPRALNRLTSTG